MTPQDALVLARAARHVFAAKGKKLVHFDMQRDPPTDPVLLQHLIGPSGYLRAPATRVGDRLFVGFSAETFLPSLFEPLK